MAYPAEMPATFDVVEASDTLTHVELVGSLDIASTRDIELRFSASTAGRHKALIVDLSRVQFLASLGLGMLIKVAQNLRADRVPVILLAPNDAIEQVLRIARLESLMPVAQTLEEARKLAGTPQSGC